MNSEDWNASYARAVAIAFSGATGDDTPPDDPFMLLLNSYWEPLEFTVPDPLRDLGWQIEIDTNDPAAAGRAVDPTSSVTLTGRSLMLLHGTQPAS
jgi:isoamylase